MSIFEKFNSQGMSPADAFEELCCQLFEYCGKGQKQFDDNWTYCNIRGAGGDGGIEAYWTNESSTECYAVQAKWFRSTLTSSQWGQIRNSVQQAIKIRPHLTQYTICIPHNLTSSKTIAHGKTSQGEDAAWRIFKTEIEKESPGLEVILWDESQINNLLVQHANEGLRRFWFEKTEVNPDVFQIALAKTVARLKSRYIPDINEDGGLSIFLDKYLGSYALRKRLIDEIDGYLETCNNITSMIDSLVAAACRNQEVNDMPKSDYELVTKAESCKNAIECYINKLSVIKTLLAIVNCLPFLGHEKWEAFFMRVDLRVKHDIEARKAAIGLFELGHGYKSAAIALSLPVEAVRRWQEIYRAFGSEVLLRMDGKQGRYTYEQKVAAASAVVDGGMTKTEAMAAFGIMSMSPLKKWCALYRRGGAEALRPRPKGRPKGSKARPRTREEELEGRCRRLEAEVAYLKKLRALVERDGL